MQYYVSASTSSRMDLSTSSQSSSATLSIMNPNSIMYQGNDHLRRLQGKDHINHWFLEHNHTQGGDWPKYRADVLIATLKINQKPYQLNIFTLQNNRTTWGTRNINWNLFITNLPIRVLGARLLIHLLYVRNRQHRRDGEYTPCTLFSFAG